jgi:hypothetical protein
MEVGASEAGRGCASLCIPCSRCRFLSFNASLVQIDYRKAWRMRARYCGHKQAHTLGRTPQVGSDAGPQVRREQNCKPRMRMAPKRGAEKSELETTVRRTGRRCFRSTQSTGFFGIYLQIQYQLTSTAFEPQH